MTISWETSIINQHQSLLEDHNSTVVYCVGTMGKIDIVCVQCIYQDADQTKIPKNQQFSMFLRLCNKLNPAFSGIYGDSLLLCNSGGVTCYQPCWLTNQHITHSPYNNCPHGTSDVEKSLLSLFRVNKRSHSHFSREIAQSVICANGLCSRSYREQVIKMLLSSPPAIPITRFSESSHFLS